MGASLMSLSTLTAPSPLHPLPPFLHALILHPLMSVSVIDVISLKIVWLPPVYRAVSLIFLALVMLSSFFASEYSASYLLLTFPSASRLLFIYRHTQLKGSNTSLVWTGILCLAGLLQTTGFEFSARLRFYNSYVYIR